MPTHSISAYKDDQKWIVFCEKCGQEEPFESQECSERYIMHEWNLQEHYKKFNEKLPFKSGLPLDKSEKN